MPDAFTQHQIVLWKMTCSDRRDDSLKQKPSSYALGYAWPTVNILRESSLFPVAGNPRQDEMVGALHYFIMLLNTKALNMSMPVMITILTAIGVFCGWFCDCSEWETHSWEPSWSPSVAFINVVIGIEGVSECGHNFPVMSNSRNGILVCVSTVWAIFLKVMNYRKFQATGAYKKGGTTRLECSIMPLTTG